MRSRRLAHQQWVDFRERSAATAAAGPHAPGPREAGVVIISSASEAGYGGTGPRWADEDGRPVFGPECH